MNEMTRISGYGMPSKTQNCARPVCMAIQEVEKQRAAEDADDDLNTTFPCHLMPREQAGLKKLVGRRCMVIKMPT